MNEYIEIQFERCNKLLSEFNLVKDKKSYIDNLIKAIISCTNLYYKTSVESLKKRLYDLLIDYYNIVVYYVQNDNQNYQLLRNLSEKLSNLFLIDQKPERFDINEKLLHDINIEEGLSNEQAEELLKWTANNTRYNLNLEFFRKGVNENVYDDSSLSGSCGFSQFSTLYPLQQLGLDVTVNNIFDINNSIRHAYGTVTIPIKEGNHIIQKRFLIDCTYRQFFTIANNVFSCYYESRFLSSPEVGFFIMHDQKYIEFAKKLLKDGFFEVTSENLEMYFKPFYLCGRKLRHISVFDKNFYSLDIINMMDSKQREFDFNELEFESWNMNLDIPLNNNHKKR